MISWAIDDPSSVVLNPHPLIEASVSGGFIVFPRPRDKIPNMLFIRLLYSFDSTGADIRNEWTSERKKERGKKQRTVRGIVRACYVLLAY